MCRNDIAILMYHGFSTPENRSGVEDYSDKHVFLENFEDQIVYLKRYHNIIELSKLIEYYEKGIRLPQKSVVITIDDGYESVYTTAYPLIKKYNIPVTIFLSTDFIERKQFLWTDRIEYAIDSSDACNKTMNIEGTTLSIRFTDTEGKIRCAKQIKSIIKKLPQRLRDDSVERIEGVLGHSLLSANEIPTAYRPLAWSQIATMLGDPNISIDNHGHTHAILSRCGTAQLKEEITTSSDIIEKRTGIKTTCFCYPNGAQWDFSEKTKNTLKEFGYLCALTTISGTNNADSDRYALKRIGGSDSDNIASFLMTIYGVRGFLSRIYGYRIY
ncbi:polysaccharide deacetylase family protein [Candidatus Omnitrophota bacterium]